MKSSRDQAIIRAVVSENESTFFKISPSPNATSEAWLLSPLANGIAETITAEDFRVSFAASEELLAEQKKRIAELPANGSKFELKHKTDRICFSGREIVLQCATSERDARLGLLKDFCRLYARTEGLERRAGELIKEAKKDSSQTGKVDKGAVQEYGRLSENNSAALLARIEFAEIKREFVQAKKNRHDGKMFAELMGASGLEDRIPLLDDEIEIAEETYCVCIDRISEFSYSSRGVQLELLIIGILVVELIYFFFNAVLQMRK